MFAKSSSLLPFLSLAGAAGLWVELYWAAWPSPTETARRAVFAQSYECGSTAEGAGGEKIRSMPTVHETVGLAVSPS